MNASAHLLADLRAHQAASRDSLALAEQESAALRQGETDRLREISESRRHLLPRLIESLDRIRTHRKHWQLLAPEARAAQPEVGFLIRQTQDLLMRAILLDRENEQGLLRRGLIPPRELPPANQQRPHFVADLYRRQSAG